MIVLKEIRIFNCIIGPSQKYIFCFYVMSL